MPIAALWESAGPGGGGSVTQAERARRKTVARIVFLEVRIIM
jgi:hypothetical protein